MMSSVQVRPPEPAKNPCTAQFREFPAPFDGAGFFVKIPVSRVYIEPLVQPGILQKALLDEHGIPCRAEVAVGEAVEDGSIFPDHGRAPILPGNVHIAA